MKQFRIRVSKWINKRSREAHHRGTIAGGKYPHLCIYIRAIEQHLGKNLRVVHIDRPIEESIASLIRRVGSKRDPGQLRKHQELLYERKQDWLKNTSTPVHTIQYSDLLIDTENQVHQLAKFLDPLDPPKSVLKKAIAYVKPQLRHIAPILDETAIGIAETAAIA